MLGLSMVVKLGLNLLTDGVFPFTELFYSHVQRSSLEVYISVSVMFNTIGNFVCVQNIFEHNLRIIG